MDDDSTTFGPDAGITRRRMLQLMGQTALTLSAGGSLLTTTAARANPSVEKPNIIFILSDNCRWDTMGFMDHPFIRTPGLDRLAREGVVFQNAFHTTPLCSPSRASILTGTYAHTHGVLNNHTPWTGQRTTFLEHLSKAGYDTAFIGKWHMPGKGLPDMPYLDTFVSYTYREGQGSYYGCPLIVNGQTTPPSDKYITAEVTDLAIDFITKNLTKPHKTRKPFCVYLSHRTAHPPFVSPKAFSGIYKDTAVTLPSKVDSWFSKTNGNVFQGIMLGSYEDQYRKYCETITAMDYDILRLLDSVDRMGLRDNTLIVYAGDNGMLWGEHRCHGIREPYEESIRIPLIVRPPGPLNDPGTTRSQMVLNLDLAPTFLDIAGITTPPEMEGESMLPLLNHRGGRKAWLLEFWKYYPENTPSYTGIRTARHKYVEYQKTRKPQLFDLKADPKEQINLYETPQGKKLLPDLIRMLNRLKQGERLSV
jgi:N-acetylglucosamine-6-sulfatase